MINTLRKKLAYLGLLTTTLHSACAMDTPDQLNKNNTLAGLTKDNWCGVFKQLPQNNKGFKNKLTLRLTCKDFCHYLILPDQVLPANLATSKLKTRDLIVHFRNLTTLNTEDHDFTDNGIAILTNLTGLSLGNFQWISSQGFSQLTNLKKLTLPQWGEIVFTSNDLRHLTNLTELNISYSLRLTDDLANHLPCLTKLDMSGTRGLTNKFLDPLPNLTELNVSNSKITNRGLYNLTNLTHLDLEGQEYAITPAGYAHLAKLKNLELIPIVHFNEDIWKTIFNYTNHYFIAKHMPFVSKSLSKYAKEMCLSVTSLPERSKEEFKHKNPIKFLQCAFPNLTELDLSQAYLSISPWMLAIKPTIKILNLGFQPFDMHSFVVNLPFITELQTKYADFKILEGHQTLQNHPKMTKLSYNGCPGTIKDAYLPATLTELNATDCLFSDNTSFMHLTNLTKLDVSNPRGNGYLVLIHSTALTDLNISGLRLEPFEVEDFQADLRTLTNLTSLNIADTKIDEDRIKSDLPNLKTLTK